MSYLCPTRRYVSPRTMYLLQTCLGLILAAEIAAVCSLLFTFLFFPVLDVNGPLMLVCAAWLVFWSALLLGNANSQTS